MSRETDVLLIRHGESQFLNQRLVGRLPNIALTENGRRQAAGLPQRLYLYTSSLVALYTSPRCRAIETATPIGRAFGLVPQTMYALDEVDFGAWTGLSFRTLDLDPGWQHYNAHRDVARIPGGEGLAAVEVRIMRVIAELAGRHAGSAVAVVTHAELIRTAVLRCCGMSLRDFHAVTVDPASISVLRFGNARPRVICLNDRATED